MKNEREPLFYIRDRHIFQRPVRNANGSVTMGFAVCEVCDGVDPLALCQLLNSAERAQTEEGADA